MKPFYYIDPDFSKTLGWSDAQSVFARLWHAELPWFEEPNLRRGGWSGVNRTQFNGDDGKVFDVFIKRQQNHNYRPLREPWQSLPTFYREFSNIQELRALNLPTLKPLFYGHQKIDGKNCSVLVTKNLRRYRPLHEVAASLTPRQRRSVSKQVGQLVASLHNNDFRHGCLYEKHIFVKEVPPGSDKKPRLKLIDLEKMHKPFRRQRGFRKDLDQVRRRFSGWTPDDQAHFRKHYLKALAKRNNSG